LTDDTTEGRFETIVLSHLNAAYNLARWLTRDDQQADDLVQEACLRALRFFSGFRGHDARAWLLTIVRNTHFTSLRDSRAERDNVGFDEEIHSLDESGQPVHAAWTAISQGDVKKQVNEAMQRLPIEFREIIVLREIEELSYKEIAAVTGTPIGTVMSRLSRGRRLLAEYLNAAVTGA
jgi:RNA polymerase sigma-70 factor, ECF subfamily